MRLAWRMGAAGMITALGRTHAMREGWGKPYTAQQPAHINTSTNTSMSAPASQLPILGLDVPLPRGLASPIQVGDIFQRFSSPEEGIVQNIIEFSIAPLLKDKSGATLTVTAG